MKKVTIVAGIAVAVVVTGIVGLVISSQNGGLLTGAFRGFNLESMRMRSVDRPLPISRRGIMAPAPAPTPLPTPTPPSPSGTIMVSLSPITPQGTHSISNYDNIAVFNLTTDPTTNAYITHFDVLLSSSTNSINPFFTNTNLHLLGDGVDLGGPPTILTVDQGHVEVSYPLSTPFVLPAGTSHSLTIAANTMDLINVTPGDDNLLVNLTTLYAAGTTSNTPKIAYNLIY